MEQAKLATRNIVRAIHDEEQIAYQQKWWEGVTKLTMGLEKSVVFISDGRAEIVMPMSSKEDLDSYRVWKFFGATPYVDSPEKVDM